MKAQNIIALILLGMFYINSCTKDSNKAEIKPRISTIISHYNNQIFSETTFYDSKGRVVKSLSVIDGSYTTVNYFNSTVTVKAYDSRDTLWETTVYYLNSKGFATSSFSTGYAGTKASLIVSHRLLGTSAPTASATYEYDNDGYLVKQTVTEGTDYLLTATRTISNGNVVSETGSVTYANSAFNFNYTYTYEYLTDKTNTIGNENLGINFLGKQNNNLISKSTEVVSDGVYSVVTTYEYDTQNRVAKEITTEVGDSNPNYNLYTYTN